MKTTKQFALAALLGIAVAVVLGTAAPATAGGTNFKLALYPPADSPLTNASGSVALTLYYESDYRLDGVWVSRLAPNTSYYMPLTVYDFESGQWIATSLQFQTNQRGNWHGSLEWHLAVYWGWGGMPILPPFEVYDSSTHALVLTSSP